MRFLSTLLVWFSLSVSPSHAGMSNEYALVFLMQSSCPYCHKVAPSVTKVSQELGLTVYTFTMDGGGLPGFQVPIPATQEIREKFLAVSNIVPATFLINVNSQKFTPISRGDIDYPTLIRGFSNAINDPEVREALQ
ncbi:conjugal transfer protein TraF [Vibrio tubiashii]|uniref:Conjugal transfer protein TrbB n=1 Tax=Vibrio tubiashii ATCC 19109 TaxID=1051646 RepID=F9T578_9VIBR|nr:conjugal transfer protein TraF [Vibrio tubiashii]AIW17431.1 conjugal transfer protein TrbB [Vibrio tubiashii ATCC 19109]EGU55275.1 putative conjugative transfer protein TrbB [Vibrio tubiashii ATCC 19109]EIF04443.1 putative conjugative transfer protein TrbB [Vibrio tubiashii NCIMB 1337 = ATCC 19106]